MKVAVLGLWHLGAVTAACTAAAGHSVIGWDPDEQVTAALSNGKAPIAEPGLDALLRSGLENGSLRFEASLADAVSNADVVWMTFDTPVDEEDRADVDHVMALARSALEHVKDGALILVSSQLPVGSVGRLEAFAPAHTAGRRISFGCVPENLRLGKAIEVFTTPDRVVVGVRALADRARVTELFAPITNRLEWMSVESAEMTKHAINAFLATSVAFINELAALCEQTGADARDVERGVKSDKRIGPRAYLSPGAAFAGGTLARDVNLLRDLGQRVGRQTPLLEGVEASNRAHATWARRRLMAELGSLAGRTVAIWGLTYKPGTDTLRRSMAVELCRWLVDQGAAVRVHDPAVGDLPPDLSSVTRWPAPLEAATGADALVVATEWPEYRSIDGRGLALVMPGGVVLDANRFLGPSVNVENGLRVVSVGQAAPPAVRSS